MKTYTFTLALSFLLLVSFFAHAQSVRPQFQKHYVLQGETAASIAEKFNITLTDFCLLNDFPKDVKLQFGQLVLIKQLLPGEEEVMETAPLPTKREHIRYEEATATPVKTTPAKAKEEVVTAVAPSTPAPSTKAVEVGPGGTVYKVSTSDYHIVQKGQTFYRVALIYGMTVDELKELNNLSNTSLEVGQKLKVRK